MSDKRIEIFAGDITTLDVDAIVNAANERLTPGSGVSGAIHRAAGPALAEECGKIDRCPTGEACITGGYDLKARHVIHTVGPVWRNGERGEDALLASCYRNSLTLAQECELATIAFPAISTGVYGSPMDRAARIAVETANSWLAGHKDFERVVFAVLQEARAFWQPRQVRRLSSPHVR